MVIKWKKKDGESIKEGLISAPFSEEELKTPFSEIIKNPPTNYVAKKERYCNTCNNCQTSIDGINLMKEFDKKYCRIVFNCINEHNLQKFDTKKIVALTGATNLTNNAVQNKALAVLTSLGYLSKDIYEYENKKGKVKMKYLYSLNEFPKPPKCYDKFKLKHFNWWDDENETREKKYN